MNRTLALVGLLLAAPLAGVGSADTPELQVDGPFGDVCAHADGDAECNGTAVSATGDAECRHAQRPEPFLRCEAVTATGNASCPGHDCLAASGTGDARGGFAVSGLGDAACSQSLCVAATVTGNASCGPALCGAASATGLADCEGVLCVAASGTGEARCEGRIRCFAVEPRTDCVSHPPIEITERKGSEGFVLELDNGTTVPRPGSGVVAGNGTAEDPYVIEGWCVLVADTENEPVDAALQISDTDAHVVVRDNVIGTPVGGGQPRDPGPGVDLDGAANVTISNNTIQRTAPGLLARSVDGLDVENNTVVRNLRGTGLLVSSSADVRVADNRVEENGEGIRIVDSSRVQVTANAIRENRGEFPGHDRGGSNLGLELSRVGQARIAGNVVEENHRAILLDRSPEATVRDNVIEDNDRGLVLDRSPGTTMRGNAFVDDGVRLDGPERLHYRQEIDRSNTVNGEPLVYLHDRDQAVVTEPAGQVVVTDSTDVQVQDIEVRGTDAGVQAAFSPELFVEGATLVGNDAGLNLSISDDAVVTETLVEDSREVGVAGDGRGDFGTDAWLSDVSVTNTTGPGVLARGGIELTLTRSLVAGNGVGVAGLEESEVELVDTTVEVQTLASDLEGSLDEAEGIGVLADGAGLEIDESTVADNPAAGIAALQGAHLTIRNSTIEGNGFPEQEDPPFPRVSPAGIYLEEALRGRIVDSAIQDNQRGLDARGDSDLVASHNLFQHNQGEAVEVRQTVGLDVTENEIRDNGQGVDLSDVTLAEVRLNNIQGNGIGVSADGGVPDATDNWWGCPFGPDHPDCDAAFDADFTPWRSQPVPDVGPR